MGSQNWWFGDPRTLLYRVKPLYRRVQWFFTLGWKKYPLIPMFFGHPHPPPKKRIRGMYEGVHPFFGDLPIETKFKKGRMVNETSMKLWSATNPGFGKKKRWIPRGCVEAFFVDMIRQRMEGRQNPTEWICFAVVWVCRVDVVTVLSWLPPKKCPRTGYYMNVTCLKIPSPPNSILTSLGLPVCSCIWLCVFVQARKLLFRDMFHGGSVVHLENRWCPYTEIVGWHFAGWLFKQAFHSIRVK